MTWRAGSLLQAGRDGKMRRNIPTPSVLLCFDFSKNRLTATTLPKLNPNMFATSVFASSPKKKVKNSHQSPWRTSPQQGKRFSKVLHIPRGQATLETNSWKIMLGSTRWSRSRERQDGQRFLQTNSFFHPSQPFQVFFCYRNKSCLIDLYPYKIWNWHTKNMDWSGHGPHLVMDSGSWVDVVTLQGTDTFLAPESRKVIFENAFEKKGY